jgi:hypothetical protein
MPTAQKKRAWKTQALVNNEADDCLITVRHLVRLWFLLTRRGYVHSTYRIAILEGGTARRAGHIVLQVAFNVGIGDGLSRVLLHVQGPLLNGPVDLPQVADTSVLHRRFPSFREVGNRDGRQQSDNGDDNHDFHQSEGPFLGAMYSHNLTFLYSHGVDRAAGGYIITLIVHELPLLTAIFFSLAAQTEPKQPIWAFPKKNLASPVWTAV